MIVYAGEIRSGREDDGRTVVVVGLSRADLRDMLGEGGGGSRRVDLSAVADDLTRAGNLPDMADAAVVVVARDSDDDLRALAERGFIPEGAL